MLCPTLVVNYSDSILSHRIEQQGCKGKPRKEGQGLTMHTRKQHKRNKKSLTRATITHSANTFLSFHHICLLTLRAPLLNAVACPAIASVLSTSNSILSPLLRICSTFWTMISLTWFNSVCALVSSSIGGAVLYVLRSAAIVGPNVPCKPYAGMSSKDDEEGAAMNCC